MNQHPIETLEQTNVMYRTMHQDPKMFKGGSLKTYIHDVGKMIQDSNVKSLLDYGCGKAISHTDYNLQRLWRLERVGLFDPGVEKYSNKPEGTFDMTVCIDVMEHVPEECVDIVLADIASYTKKIAVFSISTRPASKILPDGRNAHLTVKDSRWWLKRIGELPFYTKVYFPC